MNENYMTSHSPVITDRDLVITRIINASPDKLFRAWTDPKLITQWFAPAPSTTPLVEVDPRPGGAQLIIIRNSEGKEAHNHAVYLEIIENKKIVFTDAYVKAWVPSVRPFITVILTFEDLGDGSTRYTALVKHWAVTDREMHESWGFYAGWNQCTDQLTALVERL